jgi:protein arginine N-methyltransferase 1
MYHLLDFGMMLAHTERIEAYTRALERSVGPDSVVLDIGTGTGIFALLACRSGARKVYAVDTNDAILVGRAVAEANGYADRIEFIQDLSTNVTLPEPADVVVSDIGGALPLFQNHLPSILDARERLLAPGGRLIPQADNLLAALFDCPEDYRYLTVWEAHDYGFDMGAARELAANSWWREKAKTGRALTATESWATLDYHTLSDVNLRGEFRTSVKRPGTAHAILVWSQRTFADGIELSDFLNPNSLYRRVVFPLSEPTEVVPGDTIHCRIDAFLLGDDYAFRWRTRIVDGRTSRLKAEFDQSTVAGEPLAKEKLKRTSSPVDV